MYDPPSKKNWVYKHKFNQNYADAYNAGYEAAKAGRPLSDNPYKESGHERDTTFEDELGYWWYSGWSDYES